MFIVEAAKPVFSACTRDDGGCSQTVEPKVLALRGRYGRFVDGSAFHTSFRGAPLHVGNTAEEVVSPSATSTEFDTS